MSDPIQRYGLLGQYDEWVVDHDSDGEFVLFTDHTAAIAAARVEGVREGMLKAADEDLIWEALTDANDVDVSFLDFARAVARAIRAAAEAQP